MKEHNEGCRNISSCKQKQPVVKELVQAAISLKPTDGQGQAEQNSGSDDWTKQQIKAESFEDA